MLYMGGGSTACILGTFFAQYVLSRILHQINSRNVAFLFMYECFVKKRVPCGAGIHVTRVGCMIYRVLQHYACLPLSS